MIFYLFISNLVTQSSVEIKEKKTIIFKVSDYFKISLGVSRFQFLFIFTFWSLAFYVGIFIAQFILHKQKGSTWISNGFDRLNFSGRVLNDINTGRERLMKNVACTHYSLINSQVAYPILKSFCFSIRLKRKNCQTNF